MSDLRPMHPELQRDDPDEQSPVRVLLVSGSVRDGSTNTAVLRTVQALAPPNVEAILFDGILLLPHFNPDDDAEGAQVPGAVAQMRKAVTSADALLICTPEYAGAMPAVLKNLLEWTIGDASTYRKPVAWINASSPAAPTGGADAHESLEKVLRYAHADIVGSACIRLQLTRGHVGASGLIEDAAARRAMANALATLVDHAIDAAEGHDAAT
jgi:chromate reductase, NAD(P)H dehydrogenase (quinone)